jgi:hypothetical protein
MFKKIVNKIKSKKDSNCKNGYLLLLLDSKVPTIILSRDMSTKREDVENKIKSTLPNELKEIDFNILLMKFMQAIYPFTAENLKYLLLSVLKIVGKLSDESIKEKYFIISLDSKVPHVELNFTAEGKEGDAINKSLDYIKDIHTLKKYVATKNNIDIFKKNLSELAHTLDDELKELTGKSIKDFI